MSYSDVNPNYGLDGKGELLYSVDAINASIENIFGTFKRERLFIPEFGSDLPLLLFEPIDEITALKIQLETIDAINLWEPRVVVISSQASVVPIYEDNMYEVYIPYRIKATDEVAAFNKFLVQET